MKHKKPKLVCVGETFLTTPADHHLPMFERYFEVSDFTTETDYDASHTFIYQTDEALEQVSKYKSKGCRFIADGLWEKIFLCNTDFDDNTIGLINNGYSDNSKVLQVPKWFWFEEYFGQKHRKSQVKSLPHEHRKEKDFLMQIGKHKPEREQLLTSLQESKLLDNSIHSVLFQGKSLEGPVNEYDTYKRIFSQRNYKPEWYNSTYYTLVVESTWDEIIFITEKTWKPIMYGHPFMIFGNPGTLAQLESWGFITFDNMFDQEYDSISDWQTRLVYIIDQVKQFNSQNCIKAIQHNFDRFWNNELVEKLIKEELIDPILAFVLKS